MSEPQPVHSFTSGSLFCLLKLQLMRSLRKADFKLYIDSLSKRVPCCFALDHCYFARWLPLHLRDMVSLNEKHPTISQEYLSGNFTDELWLAFSTRKHFRYLPAHDMAINLGPENC